MPEHTSSFSDEIRPRVEVLEAALENVRSGEPGAADSLRRVSRSIGNTAERFGLAELRDKAHQVVRAPSDRLEEGGSSLLKHLRGYLAKEEVAPATLLLVEDDPDMLRLLERILSAPERRILTAMNGSGMERILAEHRTDLILMDLFLPDADGRDLLLRIREDPATAGVPVVVCSAVPAEEAMTESLALGADDYLEKPIDPGLARTVVAAALRKASPRAPGPRMESAREELRERSREESRITGMAALREEPRTSDTEAAETKAPFKVLLAEDDELSAALVRHRLQRDGFEVSHFDDGLEALAAAEDGRFDLVLLDVKLPGMEGFELLERIRSLPHLRSVPVVMLTSLGREEDVVRGFELGARDYILKPFSPLELSARLARLLSP